MKKFIALALVTLGISGSARAQWIVFDPTMNVQSILNTAQEIAKFVEVINNQVQQIQTLTDQLNEFKHYESLFGDPKAVLLTTVQPLVNDLRKTELGETLAALEGAVDAGEAMLYDANRLFTTIGTTFSTPNGANVTRRETPYLPVAAVQKTTDNFLSVSTDATARRIALKEEIARTTTALKSATTDAEVQKLSGVLIGLSSALNNTDYEINQATASALQDVANRNDAQRQIEAKKEQQHAEFTEAVQKYGQTFRLMNAPTAFPTPNTKLKSSRRMANFQQLFPTFLQKCAELHELLRIVAFMLFIVGDDSSRPPRLHWKDAHTSHAAAVCADRAARDAAAVGQ